MLWCLVIGLVGLMVILSLALLLSQPTMLSAGMKSISLLWFLLLLHLHVMIIIAVVAVSADPRGACYSASKTAPDTPA